MKLHAAMAMGGLALGTIFPKCAGATSIGAKHLDIRQIEGRVAACLPQAERESIELKSAYISATSSRNPAPPDEWGVQLIPGSNPVTLRPDECITLGQSIPGYKQQGSLHILEEGETYDFLIRRGDKLNEWTSHIYVGLFCVARDVAGRIAYLPYIYRPDGTITYPPCGRYAGLPAASDGFDPPRPANSYPIQPEP